MATINSLILPFKIFEHSYDIENINVFYLNIKNRYFFINEGCNTKRSQIMFSVKNSRTKTHPPFWFRLKQYL